MTSTNSFKLVFERDASSGCNEAIVFAFSVSTDKENGCAMLHILLAIVDAICTAEKSRGTAHWLYLALRFISMLSFSRQMIEKNTKLDIVLGSFLFAYGLYALFHARSTPMNSCLRMCARMCVDAIEPNKYFDAELL